MAGTRARELVLTARAVPVVSIGGVAALAALPTLVTVARGGTRLAGALAVAALLGGAGLGYALDDPASPVLAASPIPLGVRRLRRVVVAAAIVGTAWALSAAVAVGSGHLAGAGTVRGWGALALAASGVALAVGAVGQRALDQRRPGFAGLVAAVLTVLVSSVLAQRYPWLPTVASPRAAGRWAAVAVPAWAIAAWASRDPARR